MADPIQQGVVQGTIEPIRADKLLLGGTMVVPLPAPAGVHVPQLVSREPLVVAAETLAHAKRCAERVRALADELPHTEQAGDLLAMAFAVLHYSKET